MEKKILEMQTTPLEIPKKIHPVKVHGRHATTNYELGRGITKMRYDQVCEVFRGMLDGFQEEIDEDEKRGRVKLVKQVSNTRIYLNLALVYLKRALRICRPHMDHEFNREKGASLSPKDPK